MPAKRRTQKADTQPFRVPDNELPWDDLPRLWRKDKTLREVAIEWDGDGQRAVVGCEGKRFAVLTPGVESGSVHIQERSYKGRTEGCPRYDVYTKNELKLMLGIAAGSARTRDLTKAELKKLNTERRRRHAAER